MKTDQELRRSAVLAVVLQEPAAHVAGGDANDGIFAGVVGRRPAEQLDADHPFFERIESSGDGLIDNVGEELDAAMAASKRLSLSNLLKVRAKRCYIFPGFGNSSDLCFPKDVRISESQIMILTRHVGNPLRSYQRIFEFDS